MSDTDYGMAIYEYNARTSVPLLMDERMNDATIMYYVCTYYLLYGLVYLYTHINIDAPKFHRYMTTYIDIYV